MITMKEIDDKDKEILAVLSEAGVEGFGFNEMAKKLPMTPITLKAHLDHMKDKVEVIEKDDWRQGQKKHYRLKPHYQEVLSYFLMNGSANSIRWAVLDLASIIDLIETRQIHDAKALNLMQRVMLTRQHMLLISAMKYNLTALSRIKDVTPEMLYNSTTDLMTGINSIYDRLFFNILWDFLVWFKGRDNKEMESIISELDEPVKELLKELSSLQFTKPDQLELVKKHEADLKAIFKPDLIDAIIKGQDIYPIAKNYVLRGLDWKIILNEASSPSSQP